MHGSHRFFLFGLLVIILSCQTPRKNSTIEFKYSEFEKVLLPKSELMPQPGGKESLLLLTLPTDKYSKLYRLDHDTQSFIPEFDFGKPIAYAFRDPAHKRYYLLVDSDGFESYSIYQYDIKTKTPTLLFGNSGFQALPAGFAKKSDVMYLRSNHENKNSFSVYRLDIPTHKLTRITMGKVSWDNVVVDENETHLLLSQNKGNNENQLSIMDLKTGKIELLFAEDGTNFQPSFFDHDSSIFYLNSNQDRDRMGCAFVNLDDERPTLHWIRTDDHKDISCVYEPGSNITKIIEQYDGHTRIRLLDGVFGKELETPIPDKVVASQFSILRADDYAFVRLVSSNNPGNYYRFKLSGGKSAALNQISQMNLSHVPSQEFAQSYDLTYQSYDGMEIHAIIYAKEEWLKDNVKRPLIVWPHGGPDGQEQHRFNPFFQYWVLNGYVVVAPNVRGSIGYGKKFETLNDKDWGGGHIKDLVWARRAMIKLPYIDSKRTYIVGASFGGYSVLSVITQYPREFKGSVAMAAIANLFTFNKSLPQDPAWQTEFQNEMGDPIKDQRLYRDRSPYFKADRIKIPLKIFQAENDIRTVRGEMDQFVNTARLSGVKVDYQVLKGEGHQFSKAETWETVLQGTVDFLNKH